MTQRSKTLSSMLLVAALCAGLAVGACGDSDSKGGGQIGETITVEISAMTGGIVADRSGTASLVIPPMALEEDTTITLDVFQGNSQTESHIYEFGPDGLTFSIPATLSIVVDPMTEEGSDWLLAVEVNGTFVPLEGSAYVLGAIAAPIHHFSRFALIPEPDDTGAGGSGGGEGTGGAGGEGGVGGTGAGGMGGTGGTGGSGGQGGAGGTGGGPGLACLDELDAFTPCGGDLTGRWTIQSTCLDGIFPGPWSICDGLEGDGATVSLGEGFYYEFTETEVSSPATTVSAVAAVSYPASCFGGVSCSESSIPGFAQCDGTTTCTCHVDAVMPEEPKTANYEIDGGRLIIDDPIEQQEFEYCVQGDKLLLVSVANPSSSDRSLSIGTRN